MYQDSIKIAIKGVMACSNIIPTLDLIRLGSFTCLPSSPACLLICTCFLDFLELILKIMYSNFRDKLYVRPGPGTNFEVSCPCARAPSWSGWGKVLLMRIVLALFNDIVKVQNRVPNDCLAQYGDLNRISAVS